MAKAKKKSKASTVKKTWYSIIAPKLFNEQVIGEMPVGLEASKNIGRFVSVNLMNLTRDMRKQNTKMVFKINNVTGSKFHTEVIGFEMIPSSIKRMVRRGKRKVNYSFEILTSDKKNVKIKVIIITRGMTYNSSLTDLKKVCKEQVDETASKLTFEKIVSELVSYKFQSTMKRNLQKIYPLKAFEVNYMRVIS